MTVYAVYACMDQSPPRSDTPSVSVEADFPRFVCAAVVAFREALSRKCYRYFGRACCLVVPFPKGCPWETVLLNKGRYFDSSGEVFSP